MQTEFGIHHRLESCGNYLNKFVENQEGKKLQAAKAVFSKLACACIVQYVSTEYWLEVQMNLFCTYVVALDSRIEKIGAGDMPQTFDPKYDSCPVHNVHTHACWGHTSWAWGIHWHRRCLGRQNHFRNPSLRRTLHIGASRVVSDIYYNNIQGIPGLVTMSVNIILIAFYQQESEFKSVFSPHTKSQFLSIV